MITDAAEGDIIILQGPSGELRIGLSTSNDYVASLKNWLILLYRLNFHGLSCFPPHGIAGKHRENLPPPVVQT